MIRAQEKGRRLHVTIGDDEDSLQFVIDPVNVETGAALLAHFLSVYVDAVEDTVQSATDMSVLALGEANFERAQELRSEEFKDLVQVAFFWNTQGGGQQAVDAYLDGGLPKALGVVFEAAGVPTKQP